MRGKKPKIVFDSKRWRAVKAAVLVLICCIHTVGCTSFWNGTSEDSEKEARLKELLKVPEPPDLIRDASITQGMNTIQVDGVAAINGLPGTGGPAVPSIYRDQLLDEMQRHEVKDPNHFLELKQTALVRVRAFVPPGARRGDPVDLRFITPPRSEVHDLHGGWMLESRLRHQQVLQSSVRQSDVMVVGTGPVLTRADHHPSEDDAYRLEGVVLGGGRIQIDRKIGLILRPQYQHVKMATAIAAAINRRFYFFDGTTRRGIAKAIEDDFIEIEAHPRYRGNEARMVAVIRALGVAPESSATQKRLVELASRLKEPATASDAALQLEGLGECAIPTLLEGLKATNPELRFYAAEALAYLDRNEAIDPLLESARSVAAFRHPALLALQGLDQQLAIDGLVSLMDEPSLETRYGAFVAIRSRPDAKHYLLGETLGEAFRLYDVASTASPAIVISLKHHPEVVLFGSPGNLDIPTFLMGPHGIMLKNDPDTPGMLRISRFKAGEDDRRVTIPSNAKSVAEGIAAVGGGYGDVVAVFREAKQKGYLKDQLAFDPLPRSQRTYFRDTDSAADQEGFGDDNPRADAESESDEE
ncbi:flagellar basal body P-ring protein [Novipirellula aureliae]|uniref:Flagellar basal body P-ring protein n=1 Tax=Novipirellula aureliae TaxID=2527966 RepID=A0A5C6DPR5_9BACT|nr:flagellar basal body P-ring protein FlgI [Novipirellula aureliae]TWU37641.1 flagellar basal body P-ring protein [Novipirellula aureliae]